MTDQAQKRVQAAIDKADRETLSALLRIMEAKVTGNDKELIEAIKQTPEEVIEKALPVMVEMLTPPPPTANAPKMNRLRLYSPKMTRMERIAETETGKPLTRRTLSAPKGRL